MQTGPSATRGFFLEKEKFFLKLSLLLNGGITVQYFHSMLIFCDQFKIKQKTVINL